MDDVLEVWKDRTAPGVVILLQQKNPTTGAWEPKDLTGATCLFKIRNEGSGTVTNLGAGTIPTPTSGLLYYAWAVGQTATAGRFAVWATVTYGGGATEDTDEVVVLIEEHAPDPAPTIVYGPCIGWATAAELANLCPGSDENDLAGDVLQAASEVLWAASGRQFSGPCSITVRPCKTGCGCSFGPGLGAWGWWPAFGIYGWWSDGRDCPVQCGCGVLSEVDLAGYPVQSITSVKVDGVALDPTKYRLDDHRHLVRIDGEAWPACQDLTLADSAVGTWSVSYVYGSGPPASGKLAAMALACVMLTQAKGGDCALPTGAVRVTRQGVTVDRTRMMAALTSGESGILAVDAFLAATNPSRLRRQPAVWSPSLEPYPRRL